jgi:hypothetical protein
VVTAIDHDAVVATWRRAEAQVYPTVMVNSALYEQYIMMVRAIAEELADVRTDDELVEAWHERRDLAVEVVARTAPSMQSFMDLAALRDAAFCHRHRQLTRERAKEIARERLERARRAQDEWVVLFEDVTPIGSHRLEMHVRTGRALHTSSRTDADRPAPTFELEVVQLDPATGAWLVDQPPLMPARTFHSDEEWRARIDQARTTFGGGAP